MLGFAGGSAGMAVVPLQLRGSVSPPFDGFTFGSVPALSLLTQCANYAHTRVMILTYRKKQS